MNRLFLIVSVIVLLAIAIASVVILVMRRSVSVPQDPASQMNNSANIGGQGSTAENPSGTTGVVGASLPPERPSREVLITNFARTFTEQYGSYSTERAFDNIRVTLPSMTDRFRKESERTLAVPRKSAVEYYQVLTRAQSVDITKDSPDHVVVVVGTAREEERGNDSPRAFMQKLELTLVMEGATWKVDKATWR